MAANQYGSIFGHTATIQIDVTGSDNPGGGTLASAGSNDTGDFLGFGENEVVRQKVLTGTDLNGATADGNVDVNWGNNYEISANAADVNTTEFDFFSTMYHELNHVLGFGSDIGEDGTDRFDGGLTFGDPGVWSAFDEFVVSANGNAIIDPTAFVLDQTAWDLGKIGGPVDGLFFDGPNAVVANGGNPVGLFTPNPFSEGSSVSHLDDENPALAGFLMLADTDTGPSARVLSAIEAAIYEDIGYTITGLDPAAGSSGGGPGGPGGLSGPAPIPEPSTMLLLGSGLIGLVAWRARKGRALQQ